MKYMAQTFVLTGLLIFAGQASSETFNLCTGITTKTMPDSTDVTMWGYGLDPLGTGACVATVPGPPLPVTTGNLTIMLRNTLSDAVSVVIAGQALPAPQTGPVTFVDGAGRTRVRSFTHETAPGSTSSYTWASLNTGTYLYSSGTHPAVQVQMGLYGGVFNDAGAGLAYPGIAYDQEVTLLYSEIDSGLHAAVAAGTYGTGDYTSTVNYAPNYFLVNGDATGELSLLAGSAGERTLVRLLNAGLDNHAIVLQGQHLTLVAEDGNVYPFERKQYAVLMAAGKTRDAIFTPGADGTYAIYDRRLRVGMSSNLVVGAAAPGPMAMDDPATTTGATIDEDTASTSIAVLDNDTMTTTAIDVATVEIGTAALHGLAVATASGEVNYSPDADFFGSDSFTYTVRDTDGNVSNAATVSVSVEPVNDAPVAVADAFAIDQDSVDNTLDVLANDTDVDNMTLTVTAVGTPDNSGAATASMDGSSVTYSPAAGISGVEIFSYVIDDGDGGTSTSDVTVTVSAAVNQPPVANDDNNNSVQRNTGNSTNSVTINVAANDTDSDGTVDATTVIITSNSKSGTALNNGDGTVTYTPRAGKRGSDAFGYTIKDNLGAISNAATVRVNILK